MQIQIPKDHINIGPYSQVGCSHRNSQSRLQIPPFHNHDSNSTLHRKINEDIQVSILLREETDLNPGSPFPKPRGQFTRKEEKAFDQILDSFGHIIATINLSKSRPTSPRASSVPSSAPGTPRMAGPSSSDGLERKVNDSRRLSRARSYVFPENDLRSSEAPVPQNNVRRGSIFQRLRRSSSVEDDLPRLDRVHLKLFREFYNSHFQNIIAYERYASQNEASSPKYSAGQQNTAFADTTLMEPAPQIKQYLVGTAALICHRFAKRDKLNSEEMENLAMADEVVFECLYRSPSSSQKNPRSQSLPLLPGLEAHAGAQQSFVG